jgi:ATP-dependent RNA helicase DDX54/DBP10
MPSGCVSDTESNPSSGSDEAGSFDIFPTLTRHTKGNGPLPPEDDVDDDTELEEMIRRSITRRNVKAGTEFLKSTKGKKRLTKGEVGGGSFQSMGTSTWSL